MKQVRLTKKNILEQLVKYGYFAEQFPNCFSAELFGANLQELLPLVSISKSQKGKGEKNTTSPTTLSMYKNDISRRVLSVPNPEAFLRLAKYISENWTKVRQFAYSKSSLSPISFIRDYDSGKDQLINCESLREALKVKSDFINGVKESIKSSLGYKYRLTVDITNCYNSMYTHSITWAVCGKDLAKSFYRTKEPKSIEADYEFGDFLDCFTRFEKNNETNGIIVGPFTSRIISELILARIDKILSKKGFVFKRYVDDYKFYFRSESQAQESLPTIEKILNEYNLTLNTAKTKIQKYPYEIITDIKDRFDRALYNDGVFGVLNVASQLQMSDEKGAYKYALKYLRGRALPDKDDLQVVIPTLINIMLLDPKYGKYVTEYLKENLDGINSDKLRMVFNNELQKSLEGELQQESLLFIQLIRDLDLEISGKNLLNVIKSDNDFAIIIGLDLWKHRNHRVNRTRTEAREINTAIIDLINSLKGEKLTGSRWLLLYEIKVNKLIDDSMTPEIEMDDFFNKLSSLGVSFYRGVRDNRFRR